MARHEERRDRLLDALLALALAALSTVSVLTPDPASALPRPEPDAGLVAPALAAALPLAVRRRRPLPVWAVALGVHTLFDWSGRDPGLISLCVLLALYTVGAWRPVPVSLACLAVTYTIAVPVVALRSPETFSPATLPESGFFVVAWALGFLVRRWRLGREEAVARAMEAERSRATAVEQAVYAERLPIVRDLHDIVSHTLSVITVQAGVARHLVDERPGQAGPALTAIQEAARTALEDLRRMLELLQPDSAAAGLAPAPGVAELRLLASVHRAAHGPIDLDVDPAVAGTPESLKLTVYRVVQEALTNVRKHAPGAPVRVSVRAADGLVEVTVDDDGAPPAGDRSGGGFGLVGMAERVALFDGTLEAGPRPEGGFRVHAMLPAGRERVSP